MILFLSIVLLALFYARQRGLALDSLAEIERRKSWGGTVFYREGHG